MNLEVTYNESTGLIRFVDSDTYPDSATHLYQLWKFSYTGNELLAEGELGTQEVEMTFLSDGAYRLFVTRIDPETQTGTSSENYTQLHTLFARTAVLYALVRATTAPHWFDTVAVFRMYLVEAQREYLKSNLLGATKALTQIKNMYNILTQ